MVNGEITIRSSIDSSLLPYGSAVTASGRISSAAHRGAIPVIAPFSVKDLVKLDDNITWATRYLSVRFSVYIGDFRGLLDTADPIKATAEKFAKAPEPQNGCLIAISPNSKEVVVLSGKNVSDRITNDVDALAVETIISSLKQNGDIISAIIAGITTIISVVKPVNKK